jgi:hypothetical protein
MALYKYPATTVKLGFVLDLTIEPNAEQRIRIDEWCGWLMCCPENGFELQAPRGKLFLWSPQPEQGARERDYSAATRAYERWHKRDAKRVNLHDVPDKLTHCQGRVLRIGYRSDKWGKRGQSHEYDHDFLEHNGLPPLLYTDVKRLDKARGAVLVGGSMVIREGGIS